MEVLGRYLIKRLAEAIITLIGVAVLVFIVMRVLPGDEITAAVRHRVRQPDGCPTRRRLERYYGLDQPLIGQFFSWLGSVFSGNFGISVTSGRPVADQIKAALPVTIELAILATLIGSIVGVAIGVTARRSPTALATSPGRRSDCSVSASPTSSSPRR